MDQRTIIIVVVAAIACLLIGLALFFIIRRLSDREYGPEHHDAPPANHHNCDGNCGCQCQTPPQAQCIGAIQCQPPYAVPCKRSSTR